MVKNESFDGLNLQEDCKPKLIGGFDYEIVECLSEKTHCPAAMHFGFGLLCRHPRRKEIIETLKAMKNLEGKPE